MEIKIYEYHLLGFILIPPLLGAIINGLIHLIYVTKQEKPKILGAIIAIFASGLAFVLTLITFLDYLKQPEGTIFKQKLWDWITVGDFTISLSLQFDSLTAVMLLFITFVATLIHIYSVGYMEEDEGFLKFFSYLNLFLFSMLTLVLGDNLLVLFIGWEGVGLCSYLLISFWYSDKEKAEAGKKAFITNRIGDASFLVGVFILLNVTGTVTFTELQGKPEILSGIATLVGILLFIGATGKSAQIPLYVWLPDAMAGPTPVSALIHAATMVTAGVYLVARMGFLYSLSPLASTVVATTGILTAFFAATIAIAQYDIKKVLAYSTVSQLGYMFLGVGVGAYNAGIFHVMTHAFFKALLFLGAGSVIHALHHEQDIRRMGGLLKKIPVTGWTFIIAWLAIAGIPPFAGFFSKDEILWKAIATKNEILPWLPEVFYTLGVVTAFLTAFYMSRLMILTFLGKYRGNSRHQHDIHHHHNGNAHEHQEIKEYPVMYIPLIILAIFSTIAGFVGIPHVLGGHNYLEEFLAPVVGVKEANNLSHEWELPLMALSTLLALLGILLAFYIFLWRENVAHWFSTHFPKWQYLLSNKYFVDELYETIFLKPVRSFADVIVYRFIDYFIIDGILNNLGGFVIGLGKSLRVLHNGRVQTYLLLMFIGFVLIVYLLLLQLL